MLISICTHAHSSIWVGKRLKRSVREIVSDVMSERLTGDYCLRERTRWWNGSSSSKICLKI